MRSFRDFTPSRSASPVTIAPRFFSCLRIKRNITATPARLDTRPVAGGYLGGILTRWITRHCHAATESSGANPGKLVRRAALAEPDLERYTIRLPVRGLRSECPLCETDKSRCHEQSPLSVGSCFLYPLSRTDAPSLRPHYRTSPLLGRRRRTRRCWPPSAAQTVCAVFPRTAFTKTHVAGMQWKELIRSGSPARTRHTMWPTVAPSNPRSASV